MVDGYGFGNGIKGGDFDGSKVKRVAGQNWKPWSQWESKEVRKKKDLNKIKKK